MEIHKSTNPLHISFEWNPSLIDDTFYGELEQRVKEITKQTCYAMNCNLIQIDFNKDHVYTVIDFGKANPKSMVAPLLEKLADSFKQN